MGGSLHGGGNGVHPAGSAIIRGLAQGGPEDAFQAGAIAGQGSGEGRERDGQTPQTEAECGVGW